MYTHGCIKCGTKYDDTDPDPYYCDSCKSDKQRIAAEIDRKFQTHIPKPKVPSALELFEQNAKTFTKPDGTKIMFGKFQ